MALIRGNVIKPLRPNFSITKKVDVKSELNTGRTSPLGTPWTADSNVATSSYKNKPHLAPTPAAPTRRGRPPKHRLHTETPPTKPRPSTDPATAKNRPGTAASQSEKVEAPASSVGNSESSSGSDSRLSIVENAVPQPHPGPGHGGKKPTQSHKRKHSPPPHPVKPPAATDKKSSGRKAGAEPICDFCQLTCLANPRRQPEMLLCCKDCTAMAHPSCMQYPPLLAQRAARGPWQCMDCKTCSLCDDPGGADQMLFCDGCDRGFHMRCHQPVILKKPSGKWECSECKLENAENQRNQFLAQQNLQINIDSDSTPPTPAQSPPPRIGYNYPSFAPLNGGYHIQPMVMNGEVIDQDPAHSAPDASGWSVDDVVTYFIQEGFPNEAQAFREQDIDGVCVLLMKRRDILGGLGLRLGPALKINRLVQRLQARGGAGPND